MQAEGKLLAHQLPRYSRYISVYFVHCDTAIVQQMHLRPLENRLVHRVNIQAGFAMTTVTNPIDVVKTRLMNQHPKDLKYLG